jgi:SOS-response transcriptional repressor LexA
MKIGKIIRSLRKQKGLTIEQLAAKVESDAGNISRLERDIQGYTPDVLQRIADVLSVRLSYIFQCAEESPGKKPGGGTSALDDRETAEHSNTERVRTQGKIPLISWAQAGVWEYIVNNIKAIDAEDWIPCPFFHSDKSFILRVVGLSMYNPGGDKSYSPGDYIVVDPEREVGDRKMVLALMKGEERPVFRQLIIDPEGTRILQALNPTHSPRAIEMPEGSKIIGTVIGKWSPE